MSKITRYILATTWILFSRSFDAYATYQHTPDLQKEASPLVSILGMNWSLILLLLTVFCVYVMYAYWRYLFGGYRLLPTEKGLSLSHFTGYVATGKNVPWWSMLFRFPKPLKHMHAYFGYLLVMTLSVAGVVSTLMWILIHTSELYRRLHSPALIYTVILAGCALVYYSWIRRSYKQYQKLQSE